MLLTML